jgi:hypothetical protein
MAKAFCCCALFHVEPIREIDHKHLKIRFEIDGFGLYILIVRCSIPLPAATKQGTEP